jgi:hypothetical protein
MTLAPGIDASFRQLGSAWEARSLLAWRVDPARPSQDRVTGRAGRVNSSRLVELVTPTHNCLPERRDLKKILALENSPVRRSSA